ncbi:MAG: M1 family metallopeptidase [Cytophagales bacterium]|nr:M1 family metallopeptidase [Cytophagales bacterium]MDW8383359.1 M1 family metallopeptidase [Flammeovirgaceae bacterium]
MKGTFFFGVTSFFYLCTVSYSQKAPNKFEQLETLLPTPNAYRTASGAPGHLYWQQRADYEIQVTLNEKENAIYGKQIITYYNNSPDELTYLWLQLDQNEREHHAHTYQAMPDKPVGDKITAYDLRYADREYFDGGFKIEYVRSSEGKNLPYTVVNSMMRVDIPTSLKPKQSIKFSMSWKYNINDLNKLHGRSGYEYFPKDGNSVYAIAQFYPRMCVYDDVKGWNNRQYWGGSEFALSFGNFTVSITVPADHIVGATGTLQNASAVLTSLQLERWKKAQNSSEPVLIVTPEEAKAKEEKRVSDTKTWIFKAENVRDFAFASSRKFIWDAMSVSIGGKNIIAQSLYPKEGNPLWGKYATHVVAHALKVYSKYTINYPYPQCTAVHVDNVGMEYPMISFNFGRPFEDGTYTDRIKYSMIGVIIHEVGHNFFPMIVNSDERHWFWMDEGLNSFLEYLAEQEWERGFPSRRGPAHSLLVQFMKSDKKTQQPIMSDPENITNVGGVNYTKVAGALNILRETILGRELFDFAFKEYARRWAFKHPRPADFFRTMEDASGVDLDWFWRSWFYTTDHVDIAIEKVTAFRLFDGNPDSLAAYKKREKQNFRYISDIRNQTAIRTTYLEERPHLKDFYNDYDAEKPTQQEYEEFEQYVANLTEREKSLLDSAKIYYEIKLKNIGGIPSPLIFKFTFEDGTEEDYRLPAEIWRTNNEEVYKIFPFKKKVTHILLDPYLETADVDTSNNAWSASIPVRAVFLQPLPVPSTDNPMRNAKN